MKIICIGGGAASFFFAVQASEKYPEADITILEQGNKVLSKVAISGGGRCNLTHHCFNAKELVKNYPRGEEALLKPFKKFGPKDTIEWFESRGVKTKVEADGRMFPVSDSSQSIIDCLMQACKSKGVKIHMGSKVTDIAFNDNQNNVHEIELLNGNKLSADVLFIGAGSSLTIWKILEKRGFDIVSPVPSLFTFKIKDPRIESLSGITLPNVGLSLPGTAHVSDGPMLITHRGLSGPAILKLSARAAHYFHSCDYKCKLKVDFRPDITDKDIKSWRDTDAKKLMGNHTLLGLPKRLASQLLRVEGLDGQKKFATLSKKEMQTLIDVLKKTTLSIDGQNRFKDEFVTAGGVDLSEVDFNTFSSKRYPNVLFAGEILNIDAVTGGFNFQAAWTGAFLAAEGIESHRVQMNCILP
jgi:predicted Rossmann fold flavoprotein